MCFLPTSGSFSVGIVRLRTKKSGFMVLPIALGFMHHGCLKVEMQLGK
jgi:hypothetical protein